MNSFLVFMCVKIIRFWKDKGGCKVAAEDLELAPLSRVQVCGFSQFSMAHQAHLCSVVISKHLVLLVKE